MLPLIVRPALVELLHVPPNESRRSTTGSASLFYVPAVAGGIFGLLGGYLTDLLRPPARAGLEHPALRRLGVRRRLLDDRCTSCSSGAAARSSACASSSSPRSRGSSELFPNPKQREAVVGYTQAFGSIGGVMVTGAYYLVVTYGRSPAGGPRRPRGVALHADVGRHPGDSAHRDPSVPAGVAGLAREEGGGHAQASELRRAVPPRVPPDDDRHDDHDGVRLRAPRSARFSRCRASCRACRKCGRCRAPAIEQTVSAVQSFQEFGGLAGRIVLAFLAVRIVSRRKLLHLFQIPGLILLPIVFLFAATSSLTTAASGASSSSAS